MTRQDKYTAEIEWFNAVEKHAHKEIDKLREGGYIAFESIVDYDIAKNQK